MLLHLPANRFFPAANEAAVDTIFLKQYIMGSLLCNSSFFD